METFLTTEHVRKHWSTGKRLILGNAVDYRVGKMSYGDYFLEPKEPRGETEPFNEGTIWLEKLPKNKGYKAEY